MPTKQSDADDVALKHAIKQNELLGRDYEALALKELQSLRAVLPKVREALEFYSKYEHTDEFQNKFQSRDNAIECLVSYIGPSKAKSVLDALETEGEG